MDDYGSYVLMKSYDRNTEEDEPKYARYSIGDERLRRCDLKFTLVVHKATCNERRTQDKKYVANDGAQHLRKRTRAEKAYMKRIYVAY